MKHYTKDHTDHIIIAEKKYTTWVDFKVMQLGKKQKGIWMKEQKRGRKGGLSDKPAKAAVNKQQGWRIHGKIILSLQLLWPDTAPAAFPEQMTCMLAALFPGNRVWYHLSAWSLQAVSIKAVMQK